MNIVKEYSAWIEIGRETPGATGRVWLLYSDDVCSKFRLKSGISGKFFHLKCPRAGSAFFSEPVVTRIGKKAAKLNWIKATFQ